MVDWNLFGGWKRDSIVCFVVVFLLMLRSVGKVYKHESVAMNMGIVGFGLFALMLIFYVETRVRKKIVEEKKE